MNSITSQAKRLESAISICILAVLLLIGVGIFIKQYDVDMSRFGIDITSAGKIENRKSAVRRPAEKIENSFELSSLAPAGFEALSEIEVYNSENLYEKIDGKAPLYVESGFEQLSTQRFASKNDQSRMMELFVYDMDAAKNAFSVYSVQKRAEAEVLPDVQFGYKTSNALYFSHGKYYIELVGFSESSELFEAMEKAAGKIQTHLIVDDDTRIAELSLFPSEKYVAGSAKLYLASAFGFEGFTNTFTCQYEFDGEIITAFLSKRANHEEAKNIAENYYKFLIDNGGAAKPAADKILEGKIVDFYDTTEIVFSTRQFVVGIHEAENQQSAEKLAVMLIDKLNRK